MLLRLTVLAPDGSLRDVIERDDLAVARRELRGRARRIRTNPLHPDRGCATVLSLVAPGTALDAAVTADWS